MLNSVKTRALTDTSLSAKDQMMCAMPLDEGIASQVWGAVLPPPVTLFISRGNCKIRKIKYLEYAGEGMDKERSFGSKESSQGEQKSERFPLKTWKLVEE